MVNYEAHAEDIKAYNDSIMQKAQFAGGMGKATNNKGKEYYMGLYEDDGKYTHFKSLGAKCYGYTYEDDGEEKLKLTISGVKKKKSAPEMLERFGSPYNALENFKPGLGFIEASPPKTFYRDKPDITEWNGIKITRNTALLSNSPKNDYYPCEHKISAGLIQVGTAKDLLTNVESIIDIITDSGVYDMCTKYLIRLQNSA